MHDLIEKEKAVRAFRGSVAGRVARQLASLLTAAALFCIAFTVAGGLGLRQAANADGTFAGLNVRRPVRIYRDAQYVPHIRAADERDLFFAEGFAQGSDRLFQMDLVRRYVYGTLSEVLAPQYLAFDEQLRTLDARDVVARQWRALPGSTRRMLQAFSDGVNAAMSRQPLPVEFRLLLYEPKAWTPQDSLAVSFAVCASIGETPDDVRARDAFWRAFGPQRFSEMLPLSDVRFDVTAAGVHARSRAVRVAASWRAGRSLSTMRAGSNAWAAGGAHTADGNALLANDPHLSAGVPGFWYAVEMEAPHWHVAGVTIPGLPGVVLGHNQHLAWGTTNAIATTLSVFHAARTSRAFWRTEVFHVRFGKDVSLRYYRTAREFAAEPAAAQTLVRWPLYRSAHSPVETILALDAAASIAEAMRVMSHYAGPPQNFVVADDRGRAAYHLAGAIPDDPAWGRYVHPASDLRSDYPVIPFGRLPHVDASTTAVAISANNKMYGSGYPYRLSAMFAPPYRAYRIAQLLRSRSRYDAAFFARMQLDTASVADLDFARALVRYAAEHRGFLSTRTQQALMQWDGRFSSGSSAASVEHALRSAAESVSVSPYDALQAIAYSPPEQYVNALKAADAVAQPWARSGRVEVLHPFGLIGFPFLNGAALPGSGDEYSVRVQTQRLTQSFRAVWQPGRWDRGGLSLPAGESGEIGSGHYDDLRAAWIRGKLAPMPFDDASVKRAARHVLILQP